MWLVAVLAALASVAVSLTRPAHNALLPQVSLTTGDLTAGNALSGSLEAAATFVGPLLSGLLIALWGAGGVLVVMGGASLAGGALTWTLRSVAPVAVVPGGGRPGPVRTVATDHYR